MNFSILKFAQDENTKEQWVTLKNGVKCLLDKEGNITKGPKNLLNRNIKELNESDGVTMLKDTSPKIEEFQRILKANNGDHFKTAHDFFRKHLQGKAVVCNTPDGKVLVHFTGSGTWDKVKQDMKNDPLKAEIVPHIPDILTTGTVIESESYKESKDKRKNVLSYTKTVKTSQGERKVIVDVLDRDAVAPNPVAYNVTREGRKNYNDRQEHIKEKPQANDPHMLGGVPGNISGSSLRLPGDSESVHKPIINGNFEVINLKIEDLPTMNKPNQSLQREALSFDASSKRRYDDNGFMHVDGSHITKEQVAPYWGREIPNWQRHGLDPDKMYYGYRPADELEKAVGTFNGLPLLLHHHVESAEAPQKNYRIGSMGTSAVWNPPYIDNALSITDKVGIQAVEDGACREISSAYQYDPDFAPGTFEGTPYDFVMRNIRGNHVALVEEGRAGPDVVVADAQIQPNLKEKSVMSKLKNFFKGAFDNDLEIPAADEDKALAIRKVIGELLPMVPEEKLEALVGLLKDLAYAKDKDVVDPAEPIPGDLNAAEAYKLGEKDEIRKEEREEIPGGQDDNTAEIIAAGENHERDKLMSEHMDADRAWDACGFDSDDPAIKAAFTKGFAWGMKDGEKNGKRDAERAVAADAQIKARMDAYQKNMDAKYDAAHEVGRHVGDIRVTAFDSADDIYVHGLKEMGVPSGMYSKASARDVFRMAVKMHDKRLAQDNAPAPKFEGKFAGLNDIL